jgi:hypothetical protein
LESSFTFQAGARSIEQRDRYRKGNQPAGPCLITVDPRVYRGSTYSRHKQTQEPVQKTRTKKRTISPRDRSLHAGIPNNTLVAQPQRENRIDLEIQTEPYLQEVSEKAVIVDRDTQTDEFLDQPEAPPYIPPKNGIDIEIQVVESDLFNFDFEVQPIVSTIVGKTLEQAFLEVNEEEELIAIRRHKEAIEHQRNVELADVQRLEEAERRKFEEKQKRLEEREKVEKAQNELRLKIASRGYAEFFASDLITDAISALERRGFFYDEVERDIETNFMPWLATSMAESSEIRAFEEKIVLTVDSETVRLEEKMRSDTRKELEAMDSEEQRKRYNMLRLMLIEDRAAHRIREAMRGYEKKTTHNDDEEEDKE